MMQLATNLSSSGLLTAVLITLSVGVASGRQCFWCGPLAEQVHRSRRAPPCASAGRHITVCEPGYSHCAVVATAPPYIESRYCVKVYQDECYPQFCNTTKTWRMTCPCRGDLCNGGNGDREDEAFEVLDKLSSRSHSRIKKRAPNNKKRTKVSPTDEPELFDYYFAINENSKTKASLPIRSLKGTLESTTVTPGAHSNPIPSDQPERNSTVSDSATTKIATLFKQSNPTNSNYKTSDVSLKTSPEPALQNDDGLNLNHKDAVLYKHGQADLGEEIRVSNQALKNQLIQEVSARSQYTSPAKLVLSSSGNSSNPGSSTADGTALINDDEGIAHIASVVPSTMAADSNTPTIATKELTSLNDQTLTKNDLKLSTNSNTNVAETPTAEAFLQDTPAAAEDKDEKTSTASEATQPPPSETVHTTTETLTTQSTIYTMETSKSPNSSESSNKRSKYKNKNAADTVQASVLALITGIIVSWIM